MNRDEVFREFVLGQAGSLRRLAYALTGTGTGPTNSSKVRSSGRTCTGTGWRPDGAAAAIPDIGAVPFVLSPDGSTEPLDMSTEPVRDGTDALLVNAPPLPGDSAATASQVWALNAAERSLRPLANQPPAPRRGRVDLPTPGVVVAPIATNTRDSGMGIQLAVSTDNGRSWATRRLPSPRERSLPGVEVGPGYVSLM